MGRPEELEGMLIVVLGDLGQLAAPRQAAQAQVERAEIGVVLAMGFGRRYERRLEDSSGLFEAAESVEDRSQVLLKAERPRVTGAQLTLDDLQRGPKVGKSGLVVARRERERSLGLEHPGPSHLVVTQPMHGRVEARHHGLGHRVLILQVAHGSQPLRPRVHRRGVVTPDLGRPQGAVEGGGGFVELTPMLQHVAQAQLGLRNEGKIFEGFGRGHDLAGAQQRLVVLARRSQRTYVVELSPQLDHPRCALLVLRQGNLDVHGLHLATLVRIAQRIDDLERGVDHLAIGTGEDRGMSTQLAQPPVEAGLAGVEQGLGLAMLDLRGPADRPLGRAPARSIPIQPRLDP